MMGPPLPAAAEAEVRALIQRRRKIDAIKVVRQHTGLGLKEAKDIVDGLDRELRPPGPEPTGPSGPGALVTIAIIVVVSFIAWWWLTR